MSSLYRMYEYVVVASNTGLRTETEFFNRSTWSVATLEDPQDNDPLRYAILAVIPQFLVAAFNRLIERGLPRGSPAIITDIDELKEQPVVLETPPSWITNVPRLEEELVTPDTDDQDPREENFSPEFEKFNIRVSQPHIMFEEPLRRIFWGV
jgi:hypothetical protein